MAYQNTQTDSVSDRRMANLLLILSSSLGGSSLLVFTFFLFAGPLDIVDFGFSATASLILNTSLSFAFFVQHSGMIRAPFQHWLTRFVSERYIGAAFSIVSGLVLFLVVVLWQESNQLVIAVPDTVRWILHAIFFLAMGCILWSVSALRSFDTFGLKQIQHHLRGRLLPVASFAVRGPYRFVRHPQYTCILVMIWCFPDVTADRLLFNLLWTAWIVIGTLLEERDLVRVFGQQYRDYQVRLPMLVPYRQPAASD